MVLVEKYRPQMLDEVVGQSTVVEPIKQLLERGELPHLLFSGPPGTGKTTVAQCIARNLFKGEWLQHFHDFNASDERGIEVVRKRIKQITRIVGRRIIFLDEADNMTPDAQQALRRIIENPQSHALFILSCNAEHKIIQPILSRCAVFRFSPIADKDVLRHLIFIAKAEKYVKEWTKPIQEGFITIVEDAKGDLRRAINSLEAIGHSFATESYTIDVVENMLLDRRIPIIANDAFHKAYNGNFDAAQQLLEDSYLLGGYQANRVVEQLFQTIKEVKDQAQRLQLFVKLSDVEDRLRRGGNPLVQLTSFLAYVWVIRHIPNRCPAMEGNQ